MSEETTPPEPVAADSGPIWERQPGETAKAYGYFCTFRDLGSVRTVEAAYRISRGAAPTDTTVQASASYHRIARRWKWGERVAAYDTWADRQARQRRESEHYAELEKFRVGQQTIAKNARIVGLKLLEKIYAAAKAINTDSLSPAQIAQLGNTAARLLDVATNAEAEAVGVDEIRKLLGDIDATASAGARGSVSAGGELFDDWDEEDEAENEEDDAEG